MTDCHTVWLSWCNSVSLYLCQSVSFSDCQIVFLSDCHSSNSKLPGMNGEKQVGRSTFSPFVRMSTCLFAVCRSDCRTIFLWLSYSLILSVHLPLRRFRHFAVRLLDCLPLTVFLFDSVCPSASSSFYTFGCVNVWLSFSDFLPLSFWLFIFLFIAY